MDSQQAACKEGFRHMRPDAHPPFTEVPCSVDVTVSQVASQRDSLPRYQVPAHTNVRCPGEALLDGVPCRLVQQTDDSVLIECPSHPAEGRLQQCFVACTSAELHQAFDCFWSQIWKRDSEQAGYALASWTDFCQVLHSDKVPPLSIEVDAFVPDHWVAAIKRMKPQKATGVCGWAPTDLKLLSVEAVEILCLLFRKALRHGLPPHLLRARVCVLAKSPTPESMCQSRPITVFSTLYRVWSSVFTRQVLRQWNTQFPDTVAGSMPGRSCRDLSYRQQQRIEQSLLEGSRLLGASVDLVKCFNQIPWQPAIAMARHVGVPVEELEFWVDCLRKMRRHSSFLGDLGHGISSTNGAPEGDPFSVAIMAVLCYFAIHVASQPGLTCDTYVDNWAWAAQSTAPLSDGLPLAFDFLHGLLIPVDWAKSYCWATRKLDREWWQAQGQDVFPTPCLISCVSAAKDLGVAYSYDRMPHAALRDRKLEGSHQRLARLRDQPRPVLTKASMVQRGVWPEIFYGCEGCTKPLHQMESLRGHAARAIIGQHAALSPFLALAALTSAVQDPQAYVAERQLLALRRAMEKDSETALPIVDFASGQVCPKRSYGPATALAITLQRLELSLSADGSLKGPDNTFVRLYCCRKQEVKVLVQRAWSRKVAGAVSHRNGLSNISPPLPDATGRLLSRLNQSEQAVIARHIAGGFTSAAGRAKWADDEEPECPLCGQVQTKHHKFLQCPALQHILAPVKEMVEFALEKWPHWIHGPFAVEPPDLEVNRLIFATRRLQAPAPVPSIEEVCASRPFLRMFTDGSCCHPALGLASRAGFAIVVDMSTADCEIPCIVQQWRCHRQLPQCFRVHHLGLVPGEQNIHRAEICAVLQACQLANLHGCEAEIWTDSQVALEEWNRLETSLPPMWPDLAHELGRVHNDRLRLCKVKAHAHLDTLCGLEQWVCMGNTVADAAAKSTLANDFDLVIQGSEATAEFLQLQKDALTVFWTYLCRLSLEENRILKKVEATAEDLPPDSVATDRDHTPANLLGTGSAEKWLAQRPTGGSSWNLPTVPRDLVLACSWPPWFILPLWKWASQLRWVPDETPGRAKTGTTYLELLINFTVCTGVSPPTGLTMAHECSTCPRSFPYPESLSSLTQTLITAVRQVERLFGRPIWPPKRKKCFGLRSMGEQRAHQGVCMLAMFPQVDQTAELLNKVLKASSVLPLQAFVKTYEGPCFFSTELQKTWAQFSQTERYRLAKSVRNTR